MGLLRHFNNERKRLAAYGAAMLHGVERNIKNLTGLILSKILLGKTMIVEFSHYEL